ncbi:unnamed protein product [Bursaphelenchus xylophilus]|uniref:(pine wood nematode) hypothetical protein n=1 Tax=Bursaphelenchus xylophilus TaxID=6326 RepID=A0A1I7SL89_BURXY|nr:unnamed protein product [Bursaphelenchus xylophilus]CAG9129417.1 unnamed protein product [Bursaphelenchus xylophilus]
MALKSRGPSYYAHYTNRFGEMKGMTGMALFLCLLMACSVSANRTLNGSDPNAPAAPVNGSNSNLPASNDSRSDAESQSSPNNTSGQAVIPSSSPRSADAQTEPSASATTLINLGLVLTVFSIYL